MTTPSLPPSPGATAPVVWRETFRQLFGNAVLGLLFWAWLRIPDSHVWQFGVSTLVIAALAAAFLWLHASTIERLRALAVAVQPRVLGCVLLAGWLLIWAALAHLLQSAFTGDRMSQRAGYWNSKLPHGLRPTLTYARLTDWQGDLLGALLWWGLPTLLLPPLAESVARGLRALADRSTWSVLRHPWLWAGTGAASATAYWTAVWLTAWHFGNSAVTELTGFILRMVLAYVVTVMAYLVILALTVRRLAEEHGDIR